MSVTVLIGPAGMPAFSKRASHSSVVAARKTAPSFSSSASVLAMRAALSAKRGIVGDVRFVQKGHQPSPVALRGGPDAHPGIGRPEGLVGRVQRVPRSHGARRHASGEGDGRLPEGVRDAGLEQGGVHDLSLARAPALVEGRQHAHRQQQAAVMSVIGAPTLVGVAPEASPVMLIRPLMPWATRSKPPRPR